MKAGEWLQLEQIVFEDGLEVRVRRDVFLRTVFTSIQQVHWPRIYFQRATNDATPEPVLRSLLTCALAIRICGSQEIVAAIQEEPVLRYLCVGFNPEFQTLHEFRRRNVESIRKAVEFVLKQTLEIGVPNTWNGMRPFSRENVDRETQERLERAIRADSMALDS